MTGKAMSMYNQASGTTRKILRIKKSTTLLLLSRKFVIRKPDNVKNIAIPITPAAALNCQAFGLSGSRWHAKTSKMLMPRHPSSTLNREPATELLFIFASRSWVDRGHSIKAVLRMKTV